MKHMMIKVLSVLMALTMIMGVFGTMGISAAEHTHTKGDTVKVVKPTCKTAGYTVYKCADCKETYEDDIVLADPDAHNLKAYYLNGNVRGKGAATCTEPAATEGLRCARSSCQKIITESEYIKDSEPLGHDYTIELQLPTCENAGMVYRSCARCVAEELANAEEDVLGTLPAEEKDGFVYYGTVSHIPANNGEHVFAYEVVKAPTCKAYGIARYFCKLCDEISFENIAVRNAGVGHVYESVKALAPTCTTDGYTAHTVCTVCGTATGKTTLAKTNHANSSFLNANSDYAVKNGISAAEINTTGKDSVAAALAYASCTKDAQFWAQCNDCGTVWNKTFKAAHQIANFANTLNRGGGLYADADAIVAAGLKNSCWYPTVAATCVNGKTYTAVCKREGCNYFEVMESDDGKLGTTGKHIWGTKNSGSFAPVTTAATCTTGAFEVYKCMFPGCGSTQTVYTATSLGHDFYYDCAVEGCAGNDGNNATDCPTCAHARTKKCTRCTEFSQAIAAAAEHNYQTVDVVASCRVIAHKEDVCQNEGCASVIVKDETYTGTVDAANHAGEVLTKTVAATCYAEGTKYLACDCGAKTWTVAIPKLACNGTYTVLAAVPATCSTTGKTEGLSCSEHGIVVAQIDTAFDKTNHNVATAILKTQVVGTCYIEGYRIYTCGNAACKADTGLAPEFTITDGKNANNHANKDGVPAFKTGKDLKAATHTTAGTHGYKICAYCNVNIELDKALNTATCKVCKIANDNELPSPHRTYAEGEAYTGGILSVVEIPARGHELTVAPAIAAGHDTAGTTAALICVDCPDNNNETLVVYGGDIIAPHGDRYMVTLKNATCTTSGLACAGYTVAEGETVKVCAYCQRGNLRYVGAMHNIVTVETGRKTIDGDTVTVKACSICDAEFEELTDTWYLDNYVAAHEHNFKNDADKTKEYYNTKEVTDTSVPACQAATYKQAECQTCHAWVTIATVKAAPGHYVGAKKTPMALGCQDYVLGTNCAACGIAITSKDDADIVHNWGSGDDYGVVKVPTCTEPGIAIRACVDCGVKSPLNPDTVAKYAAYDWSWDAEGKAYVTPALGHSPISLESYEFSKESDNVVTYSATCTVCEQKYTEEVNILEDYVVFTFDAKDPNGSKWTANGSTVVVTIAYTAADYKFRDLTTIVEFNDSALTFQKAEVVADLAGASTDVVVNDSEITIYTFVSVPGETTVMSGDEVAYVDLYFTVNQTSTIGVIGEFVEDVDILAHVYDEDDKLVADYDKDFYAMIGEDIRAYVTGDVDNDGSFTPADLLTVMDLIYGEEAEYDAIADIDKDGDVDVDDFAALKTFVLSKKTAKDYIIMVKGEYVDIMSALLAIAKEEGLDADGNGVVTRSDVSDILTASSELYWYVHAGEVDWEKGASLNATMIQEADFTDALVDAYNAYMAN